MTIEVLERYQRHLSHRQFLGFVSPSTTSSVVKPSVLRESAERLVNLVLRHGEEGCIILQYGLMRWVDARSAGTIPQLFPVIDVVRKRCLADMIMSFIVFVNVDFYRSNTRLV